MKTMKQNVWVRMLSVLLSLTLICGLLPAINVWATDDDGWIQADNYTQLVKGKDYDYSFAVLGDIQHITDYTPDDLHYLFDYIIDNKESKNIEFVFGMGDITNDVHNEANNLVEWALAKEQHFRLSDAGIPYTVVRGNHDNVVRMNTYFASPEDPSYMNQLDGFYQDGNVINVWKEFSAGGVDYLSIVINYESSDSVLEWASDVIEAHPNHRVIVSTHVYLQAGVDQDGDGCEDYQNEMNPSNAQSGTVNSAQQVWDKLISQHENIFLVLSGHESSADVKIQQKQGVNGNTVTEMRVDSQTTDLEYMLKDDDLRGGKENGVGMVTMMYFKNDGTQVAVEHYSTLRDMYRELKTFEVDAYENYNWRYDSTDADSYRVDTYKPTTSLVDAPDIWQNGLGNLSLKDLLAKGGLTYDGGGASILAANGIDLKNHSFALHSGSRKVEPSSTYTVSYKINGLGKSAKVWPYIHYQRTELGGSDTYIPMTDDEYLRQGPVNEWQTVSFDITIDDKTSAVEIWLVAVNGDVYIDDFSLIKKEEDSNLLPVFEDGQGSVYLWDFTGGVDSSVSYLPNGGSDGSGALSVNAAKDGKTGVLVGFRATVNSISVKPNTRYELKYKIKLDNGMTTYPHVVETKSSGTSYNGYTDYTVTGNGEWQEVTAYFTTAADAISVQPSIFVSAGTMVVDYFSLHEPTNLLPAFENNKGSVYLWDFTGGVDSSVNYLANGGADGSGAISTNVSKPDKSGVLVGFRATGDSIAIEPNTRYELKYKIKLNDGMMAYPHVVETKSSGTSYNGYTDYTVTGNGEWQEVTAYFTTASDSINVQPSIFVSAGTMIVDSFSLCKAKIGNVIENGGFENGTDGQFPTGFSSMQIGGKGKVEKVSGVGVNGSAAVRIEPRPSYILKTDDNNRIAVSANTEYTLSYMVRVPSNVTEVYPIIRQYDNSGNALVGLIFADKAVTNTDGWQEVTVKFTTDASTVYIAVCLQVYGGQVDIDNLSVKGSNGVELVYNGNFTKGANSDGTPIGFAGEYVQGITQTGKVAYVSSARPNSIIFDVKEENGTLNAYSGANLLGTVDETYGKLEHKANFGVRISDKNAADAVAEWVVSRNVANLWVVSDNVELLSVVQSAKPAVRCVVDCTGKSDVNSINAGKFTRVLVSEAVGTNANIFTLQEKGLTVIVESATVSESLLTSGVDAIFTTDALAAIQVLENITVAEVNKFVGATVTLGADFGVNFYLELSDNAEDMKVEFVVEGDKTSVDLTGKETNGYYLATVSIAAKDMTVPIVAKLLDAEGNVVCRYTYTMKEYAEYIIKNDSYTDAQKKVAEAMLTYGGFAQSYFKYRDTELANVVYSTDMSNVDTSSIIGMSKEGNAEGYIGASLMLKSKTAVRLNFNKSVEGATQSGGRYYLEYDFDAKNLGETRTKEINGTQYTFSVLSFAKAVIEGDFSESYQNLMKALVNYANAVQQLGNVK